MLPLSEEKALQTGIWLFADLFVVSAGGWFFWLILSKIANPVEIGYATTTLSVVTLTTGIFGFGLDYALLRESSFLKGYAYGTITIFETMVLLAVSPIAFWVSGIVYGASFVPYMTLAIVAFIVFGLAFVSKFTGIGLLRTKDVFFYDVAGTIVRLSTGILLVTMGFGGLGMVTAGIFQQSVVALGLVLLCYKAIGFKWGGLGRLKNLLKIGVSNFPTKISVLIASNLSVVLLASASDPSSVGVFYIALMISLVAGGFATSIATMAIPASVITHAGEDDATLTTLRIGLCLTAPLVAALASSSEAALSLVGEGYMSGSLPLVILAISLLPTIIVSNVVSKLNYARKLRQLIQLGLIQLITFLIMFFLPLELTKTVSTSLAILASSLIASIVASKWLSIKALKPIVLSSASIFVGWVIGSVGGRFSQFGGLLLSLLSSLILILLLKGITIGEISSLLKMMKRTQT